MENEESGPKRRSGKVKVLILVAVAFVAGYSLRAFLQRPSAVVERSSHAQTGEKWTCSMHPQIIRDEPGNCPICGMQLIPLVGGGEGGSGANSRELVISEAAAKLMEIETSVVEHKFVSTEVRMFGKIDYDETRVKNITAWVPGRIDRLYVDFTGIKVEKGDHMVLLYSPELISAEAELLQASKAAGNIAAETSERVKVFTLATLEAAREKLRLLGLSQEQIRQIESSGKTLTQITIYSPMGGVVIRKNATEGTYVSRGTVIYKVADLSKLWVKLDAYESDLVWLRYGQEVEFTTEAYPGEVFKGRISFIAPVLDAKTRTVKVRVNVDNERGRLKPEMFVTAVVHSRVAQGGRVMDAEMAGKWICPMHPSAVEDKAGRCKVCGMDLVPTESVGYVAVDEGDEAPLVIPVSAPLITGRRAVVYIQVPGKESPTYEGREVSLGPRAGEYYIVKSGLDEGEVVVTRGNFKIDSAMQIQGKPSMMNRSEGETSPSGRSGGHNH